jgi:4-hydroxybenzoate polyprenyltransferase
MLLYAANDINDAHTDRLNPRKDSWLFGARPDAVQIAALPLRITLVQLPFLIGFCALLGPRALGWFGVATLSTFLYNAPKWGAKDRAGFDVLSQAGYLGVFVLSCWLNDLPLAPWPIWVFGALFAGHSHLFGQIMDIAPDAAAKRRTTAVTIGAVRSKWLIVALLLVEVALAARIEDKPWLAPALFLAAIGFALDASVLWREKPYPTLLIFAFFLGWNAVLLGEIGLSWLLQLSN